MNKAEKIAFAKTEIARAWGCDPGVFDSDENIFIQTDDPFFEIVTFGVSAVIRADEVMLAWCREVFGSMQACDIMDGDSLYRLETKLRSSGKKLGGEHVRYLHLDPDKHVEKPGEFVFKLYIGDDVKQLYEYKNYDSALNYEQDVLALAAYHGDALVAMAGADDYAGDLWQIGIDTLPQYRKRGLGAYLVKQLAVTIEDMGKVPFYTTWSANIASGKVALGAGFCPVWMGYPSEDI